MQSQKMKISKRKFRIGDLAKELKLKKYVIRFWEKEFELESDRSEGGQRFYTQEDFNLFSKIKELLYAQGYTISGAKKQLTSKEVKMQIQSEGNNPFQISDQKIELQKETPIEYSSEPEEEAKTIIAAYKEKTPTDEQQILLWQQLKSLKQQLISFKQLLD